MLVDTHCHLADAAFDDDRDAVLERAVERGVGHVVVVGESVVASERAAALAAADRRLSATAGVHPHEASGWSADAEDRVRALLEAGHVVAVGETGLDYHYDHSPRPRQRAAFAAHLALGAATGKPVVIHSREADDDLAGMLADAPPDAVLIMHSFAGGDALLEAALARGAYVGFSGMVTFRTWQGDAWVWAVPADRLLVETDAPYLAPVPHRGRRNEPGYVTHVAARVASIRGVSAAVVAADTTANAVRCFGGRVGALAEARRG